MADCGRSSASSEHHLSALALRADELFDLLADEETVNSQPDKLVQALADFDVSVSEDQVVQATQHVLDSTEEEFAKDAFFFGSWNACNGRFPRQEMAKRPLFRRM